MKAWLITWEWMSDSAAVADRVVGILNPRWSDQRVSDIVEFIYNQCSSTIAEMAYYAKRPSNNPYRAQRDFNCQITCGHHPWLWARIVDNLQAMRDPSSGIETITWSEVPIYKPGEKGPELVRGRLPQKFVRKITGSISHESIWDAATGSFKRGWEKNE